MGPVREKIHMSKLVIEFLLDADNPSYEDLLNKLQVKDSVRSTLAKLLRPWWNQRFLL